MKKKNSPRVVRYDEAKLWRRMLDLLVLTLVVTLVVEGFNQGSPVRMIKYLAHRPLYFAYNCIVVFASLCLTELFRCRRPLSWTISLLWIVLGFSNYMVCRNRTQPLVSGDLILTREILGMTPRYFSWLEIIGTFVLVMLMIFGMVTLYTHVPRRAQVNYPRAIGGVIGGVCSIIFLCVVSIDAGLIPVHFGDRVDAYHDYGFTTCFTFTFARTGIDEPDAYSDETVARIIDEIDAPEPTAETPRKFGAEDDLQRPNIVFIQLESFFDVDDVTEARFSRDPMPVFHRLMQENPNGLLYVPTIGGGTANVEFEVMTGMNMDFFGAGEAPYNTILQDVSLESIAHVLHERDYATTTLHNNTGFFFSRNLVYSHLGYDRFVPLEHMRYPEYTSFGWARDEVLTDEIMSVMRSSTQRDLIFAITVESHGKYPDTYEYSDGDVEILSLPEGAYLPNAQNYINLVPNVDAFLGDIIAEFERYDEPVLVVLYGDHLPALGLEAEMLSTGDLYASRYIIWNNYDAEFEAPDIQAYRLSAELFRQMNISDGVMFRFHQNYDLADESPEYMEKLQTLQYDLLYGEQSAYGDHGPYAPSDIVYGVEPVTIDDARLDYGRLLVKGRNFTQFSKIVAGEHVLGTVFIDENTIAAAVNDETPLYDAFCVAQINDDGRELDRTGEFTLP